MPDINDGFQKDNSSQRDDSSQRSESSGADNFQSDFFQSEHFKKNHTDESTQSFQRIEEAKTNALVAYFLMAIGIFTGIFWLIGAIWAMVKKEDAKNTLYYEHYSNIISTFWWGLLWTVIGLVTWVLVIGMFIVFIAWIWSVYRIIKGLALITSNKPYI